MNIIEKMLNSLKLTDDDDFDDDEEEMVTQTRGKRREANAAAQERQPSQPPRRLKSRPMRSAQATYQEEEESYEPKRTAVRPERQPIPIRSASQGLEVSIIKPAQYKDAVEICGMLKEERTIIINLEGLERKEADRLLDIVSGAILALEAKIYQISSYVICISPERVEISGDYLDLISQDKEFEFFNLPKQT